MDCYLKVFNHLINRAAPDAFSLLKSNHIGSSMLVVEWFFTLFARQFDLVIVRCLWDHLLIKGEVFLFRLSIFILSNGYLYFKDCRIEEIMPKIRAFCMSLDVSFVKEVREGLLPDDNYYDMLTAYMAETMQIRA